MKQKTDFTEQLQNFPTSPGVYIMKDKEGKIIYVGKAKNLKNRIKSYFLKNNDTRALISFLLNRLESIEHIVTENEKEALLLENNLIKKHQPKYNVNLKDDKNYLSIMIDLKEDFPKINLVRKKSNQKNCLYFGPFSSARYVKATLIHLQKMFPLRLCTSKHFQTRPRPCLNFQIKKCLGPCSGKIDKQVYRDILDKAILLLQGKGEKLISDLKSQMQSASNSLSFEKAAEIRDQIEAIKQTLERQSVSMHNDYNQDVITFEQLNNTWFFQVMLVRTGKLIDTFNYKLPKKLDNEKEILSTFISQYYLNDLHEIPGEIIIPEETPYKNHLREILEQKTGQPIKITVPKTGLKYNLLSIARKNLNQTIKQKLAVQSNALQQLKEKLHLPTIPKIIECFDISNILGTHAVGGVIVYRETKFCKERYRKYKIKTVKTISDYEMMAELLTRHLRQIISNKDYKPDLLLIDGGKGHLNIALSVLKLLKINDIAVASIAKEKNAKENFEKIYLPNRKNHVNFQDKSPGILLLTKIRDEAHRFAITYHKNLRDKQTIKSALDEIQGIGPAKKIALLEKFGNVDNIKESTGEQLCQIKGITKSLAKNILQQLNQAN